MLLDSIDMCFTFRFVGFLLRMSAEVAFLCIL